MHVVIYFSGMKWLVVAQYALVIYSGQNVKWHSNNMYYGSSIVGIQLHSMDIISLNMQYD